MASIEVISNFVLYIFIITTMVSIGLGLNIKKIKSILSNYSFMARGLLVNFLLIPIIAWVMTKVIPMEESVAIGFLLASISAGAPFSPKLAQVAKSDVPFAVTMMFVLLVLAVVVTPGWLSVFLNSSASGGVSINTLAILSQIIIVYLLPLLIAILAGSKYSNKVEKCRRLLLKISNVAFIIVIVLTLATSMSGLESLVGSFGIIAGIISVPIYAVLGYLLGGPRITTKRSLSFNSAVRNTGLGLLIASHSFSNTATVGVMVITFGIIQTVIMASVAALWSKRGGDADEITVNE